MSVYVDDMKASYGYMKMCHMMADSTNELTSMADKIGVDRRWLQKAGSYQEHFDIALSKRRLAVQAGAIEVTRRQLGAFMILKRGNSDQRVLDHARNIWSEIKPLETSDGMD